MTDGCCVLLLLRVARCLSFVVCWQLFFVHHWLVVVRWSSLGVGCYLFVVRSALYVIC